LVSKMKNNVPNLIKNIPDEMKEAVTEFLYYVNSLSFTETPNYDHCSSLFEPTVVNFKGTIE